MMELHDVVADSGICIAWIQAFAWIFDLHARFDRHHEMVPYSPGTLPNDAGACPEIPWFSSLFFARLAIAPDHPWKASPVSPRRVQSLEGFTGDVQSCFHVQLEERQRLSALNHVIMTNDSLQEAAEKEAGNSAVHGAGGTMDQCDLLPRAQHRPAGSPLRYVLCPRP